MGITDLFSDFLSSLTFTEAHAEAPSEEKNESSEESNDEGKDDEDKEDDAGGDQGEEEEEEEEEEEPEDVKPKLEEECANSKQCAPFKHHFDECVERVTEASEHADGKKGPHEDCVEEFFHLAHCANQCAAPKLWAQLK